MPILPGRRLGPYEILSAIGAGGMGEVYRARDTRLDRIVAIKVLPAHLADRSELRERFDREAKTIASLNHPHICVLHDIGHQDEIDFLVMEYLEGETLAQRLLKGSLPLEQVLQYAIEIADALDKAHRKGVTHRDLKPGNIMLTKSGTKLLDFGLAKLKQEAAPANVPLSELPTVNDPLTAQGSLVGTLQYMAPEQVEGKEADARTDIFAFGAIVYEMATGKRAFEGKSQASLMVAILERDPLPMSSLQPMTPPALDRVVKKCLAKESEKRWQAASDVCDELKWIAEGGSQVGLAPTAAAKGIRSLGRRTLIISLGTLLLGAAIAGLAVWNLKPAPLPKPVSRFTITLPPGEQLSAQDYAAIALSPDGTHLAYVATQGGTPQLYLRAMDSLEATKPIPGTEGAVSPFFSPDGQWLGFFARGLTRLTSEGSSNQAPAWTPDGKRIAFGSNKEGPANLFWQLADGSGGLERLATTEYENYPMSWSPDGQLLAFVEINPTTGYDIWVLRLGDRKAQPFLRTPFNEGAPRFSPDGRWLAYVSDESGRYEVDVQPYPGPGGKWQISSDGGTEPMWNRNGRELFYRSGDKMMAVDIAAQPSFAAGKPKVLFEGPYQLLGVANPNYDVSPDGQRFLMLKPSEPAEAAPTQINVVLNWFEELKQKVPTGKK